MRPVKLLDIFSLPAQAQTGGAVKRKAKKPRPEKERDPPGATIEDEFARLTAEWKKATAHYSKVSQVAQHPAYRQIIEMGESVVPLILQNLKQHGGRWFQALREITKTNPATSEIRGNIEATKAAWLKWGMDHGCSVQ